MEAIVLAGGLGTRLRSVVSDVPKPMALVNHKPFLEYVLRHLIAEGVTRFILSVGYKSHLIQNYFSSEFNGVPIEYSIENSPLGTGGAISMALAKVHGNKVFVVNGDTFFDVRLSDMTTLSDETDASVVLALKELHDFDRYGVVDIGNDGRVSGFREKGRYKSGYINCGIYLIRKNLFSIYSPGEKFSFEEYLASNTTLDMYGVISGGYFIDIGIPEDYEKAQREFR